MCSSHADSVAGRHPYLSDSCEPEVAVVVPRDAARQEIGALGLGALSRTSEFGRDDKDLDVSLAVGSGQWEAFISSIVISSDLRLYFSSMT